MSKNIEQIMKILSKKYCSTDRTTLNRMRRNKKSRISNSSSNNRERNQNAFKILIACLLSLRARDENTEKVSRKLFEVADTPEKIISLPVKKLEKLIYSSGHYKKKARVLQHVSRELIDRFYSKVPDRKEELLSIKGIGPKTANIVLAFAFGKNVLPIDTHCHRVPNRLGWVKTKTPEKTEKELEKILPKKFWNNFNAIFVQFGREICQPISPWCSKCPVEKYCEKVGVKRSR